jgi:hypothetical protein
LGGFLLISLAPGWVNRRHMIVMISAGERRAGWMSHRRAIRMMLTAQEVLADGSGLITSRADAV